MLFWAPRNKVDMQNVRMPDARGLSARDFAVLGGWGSMQCSLVPSMGFHFGGYGTCQSETVWHLERWMGFVSRSVL